MSYPQQGQQGFGQHGYGQQGFGQQGPAQPWGAPRLVKRGPVGPILLIFSAVLAIVSIFLPWNRGFGASFGTDGITFAENDATWNGLEQMMVNIENGRSYGYLMMVAFILAGFGALMSIIAAIIHLASNGPSRGISALAIVAGSLGLLGTFGMLLGYFFLGAFYAMMIGVWLYGVAFLPGFMGSFFTMPKRV